MSSLNLLNSASNAHAIFSPSQSQWLRYDVDKMVDRIISSYRSTIGTELHDFAASQIALFHRYSSAKNVKDNFETFLYEKYKPDNYDGYEMPDYVKKLLYFLGYIPKEVFKTIESYVNDGIKYRMTPEVRLEHSNLFFGTADCIGFSNDILRIHDLKTGALPVTHLDQLAVYAALYCMSHRIKPIDISIELRIYQNDQILIDTPDPMDILNIMDFIINRNKELENIFKEVI